MLNERRNYGRRAESMRRVVERLLSDSSGVLPASIADDVLHEAAAGRILKRLAIRGFARIMAGKWVPTPVLLTPGPLLRTVPDPLR
jgi:hypothetical protein